MRTGQRGELRVRIGDYRIVYEIEDDLLLVVVFRLGQRGYVSRGLQIGPKLRPATTWGAPGPQRGPSRCAPGGASGTQTC